MAKKHIFDIKTNINSLISENLVLKRKYILNAMKLGTQSRSSSLIKILYDGDLQKQRSPALYKIAILKDVKSHKNVMESLFKIKTCKSFKEMMVSFFNIQNFNSRKKFMQLFSVLKSLRVIRKWWSSFSVLKTLRQW